MTVDRKMFTDRFDKRKAHLLLTNASHTTYFYSCITKNLTLFVVCNWFEFFPIQYVLMLVTMYITNKYELETFRLGISFRVGMRFEIMLVVCQVFNPSCILSWQAKKRNLAQTLTQIKLVLWIAVLKNRCHFGKGSIVSTVLC